MDERHDTARHPIAAVPPPVVASPVDVPAAPSDAPRPADATLFGDVPWWRPGWADVLRVLGWRWLILLPALALGIGFPFWAILRPGRWMWLQNSILLIGWGKLLVIAWAVIVSILTWGVRNVVRARRDPFCIHCGYSLSGLAPEGQCPECGRFYRPDLMEEFKKDPHFFAHRHSVADKHPAGVGIAAGDGPTAADGTS